MEDTLISFETAKIAKEKGFEFKVVWEYILGFKNNHERDKYLPTQSLLAKWLREKHNIIILVLYDGKTFYYQIQRKEWEDCIIQFDLTLNQTYEEAYEIGLQEALKLI